MIQAEPEDGEEDDSPPVGGSYIEQSIQLLLAHQVAELKKARRKKKGIAGLLGFDSEDSDEDSLTKMRRHHQAFSSRMEANMLQALEDESLTGHTPMRYIQECLPATLGHMVSAVARIHQALIRDEVPRARMLAVGTLIMTEQSALDGSWKTAWRVLGMQ